jgi:hypothetical protein
MGEQYTTRLNFKKEKTEQGDILPVTAQNPTTIVVAGNSGWDFEGENSFFNPFYLKTHNKNHFKSSNNIEIT